VDLVHLTLDGNQWRSSVVDKVTNTPLPKKLKVYGVT
jgi:hypothetical protein